MGYYVYILRCTDGSLYTGITTDLARRFSEHAGQGGRGAKYTAARRPERYECAWCVEDRASASRLEWKIKTLTRAQKLRLIAGEVPAQLEPDVRERLSTQQLSELTSCET